MVAVVIILVLPVVAPVELSVEVTPLEGPELCCESDIRVSLESFSTASWLSEVRASESEMSGSWALIEMISASMMACRTSAPPSMMVFGSESDVGVSRPLLTSKSAWMRASRYPTPRSIRAF